MMFALWLYFILLMNGYCIALDFLTINKSNKTFQYKGNTVFLSGSNQPWVDYANDFGNSQANGVFCQLNYTLANLTTNGANSVREWLFIDGSNIPQFDSDGNVISTDSAHTLIKDLKLYLQAAAAQNIFVFLVLWNGAQTIQKNELGLIMNVTKLQTFIDNALIPLIKGIANEPGLGGYDIINEPCGSIKIETTNNNCTNTQKLKGTGAGWTNSNIPMKNMQQFINLQASAIHEADPKALVSVGIWQEVAATDNFGYFNYFKDECLIVGGNKTNGILDFQQLHTYAFNNKYNQHSPIYQIADDFDLDKPLVIGEFENQLSQYNYTWLYSHFYNGKYNGAWSWAMSHVDDPNDWKYIDVGVGSLKNKTGIAVQIDTDNVPSARCWCSDVAPDNQYTCQQQAGWGHCNETWLSGYCCQSCKACIGCT